MNLEFFMNEAIKEAKKAFALGEIPVGAVVEYKGEIIGRGHNLTESTKDPTAHAEMIAIKMAAENRHAWRLTDSNLYVTAEPCPMCAGAIVLSRLKAIYIGTLDPKTGACGSIMDIPRDPRLNHNPQIISGVLEEECRQLLKDFFRELRNKKKTT